MRKRILIVLAVAAAVAWKTVDDRYPWLWAYLAEPVRASTGSSFDKLGMNGGKGPTHVMFVFADHFEPHDQAALDRWMADYPALADRHKDADGKPPQHSWFWYFSQSDDAEALRFLQQLSQLSYRGYGETELHLHHWADTEKTFLEKIGRMIALSQKTGAMVTAEPRPRTAFGFIHGMWALDNSRPGSCGVNNELTLLNELGCYADFTHPSWGKMHPRTVNRLYYATDDPAKPKSYDSGPRMQVGGVAVGDLLIFEGPSVVHWKGWRPVYDHGDVTMADLPTEERIDGWVRAGVHVKGRPEWVFVKVFTHGAVGPDHDAVLGDWADRMHSTLERKYNDGARFRLHYVTAREAYNIAKAAEAGKSGNPNDYRDFAIPPYVNRFLTASAPFEVLTLAEGKAIVWFSAPPDTVVELRVQGREVALGGDALGVTSVVSENDILFHLTLGASGQVELTGVGARR